MIRLSPIFSAFLMLLVPVAYLSAADAEAETLRSGVEIGTVNENENASGNAAETPSGTPDAVSKTAIPPAGIAAGVPWRFSWSLNFEGILKFVDDKVGFNPLFLYNDKMLNRDTFRLNFTMMPSDLYTAVVYTYLNIHLRNIYDAEKPDEGGFLYRNRYGVGWDNRFSFAEDLDLLFGMEYRLDQSNWNSFKHRLAFRTLLQGSGVPGLNWSLEQKLLPFFTRKAAGLSSFETETLVFVGYEFFQAHHPAIKADGYTLTLYNDLYFDTTSYPDGAETEYYLEESVGIRAGLKDVVRLTLAPTWFFHNLPPYKNVNLLGFKSTAAFVFKTKPIAVDGELLRAAKTYTLSASYWGAHNFDRQTWDHLLQVVFGISYPGVTQNRAKTSAP